MLNTMDRIDLQLFAEGGDGAGNGAASSGAAAGGAETGEAAPDAGEERLRALGVPEDKLAKHRARRSRAAAVAAPESAEDQQPAPAPEAPKEAEKATPAKEDAPKRMTWDEIMQDPEYNRQMQTVVSARLKEAKAAQETLNKLQPAVELLARRYNLDAAKLDADALAKAISDDDSYYEDKALELGVPVDAAKKIDKMERENARRKAEEARSIEEQRISAHLARLQQQGEAMKQVFPGFNLSAELQNPVFMRMTSPNVGLSVEDAYYAVHRKEIQEASMKAAAENTAKKVAASISAGKSRPVENGGGSNAPSVTTFDYAKASKSERDEIKRRIYAAAARGEKIYPGQIK